MHSGTAERPSGSGGTVIDDGDGANWMRDLAPRIGDRPLSQVVIPGTHDAGTFSFPSSGASIVHTFKGQSIWYRDRRAGRQVGSRRDVVVTAVLPEMPGMVAASTAAGYSVLSTDLPELGSWPGDSAFARLVVELNLVPRR